MYPIRDHNSTVLAVAFRSSKCYRNLPVTATIIRLGSPVFGGRLSSGLPADLPVAHQLRRLRQQMLLSQQDLADRAHVHVKTVIRIEHLNPARPSTLRRLARVLGLKDPRELTDPSA